MPKPRLVSISVSPVETDWRVDLEEFDGTQARFSAITFTDIRARAIAHGADWHTVPEGTAATEASDFATKLGVQYGLCVQWFDAEGNGTSVMVPNDRSYVAPNATVYVVWGPTADWADGTGPLSWHLSRADARRAMYDRQREDREFVEDTIRESGDSSVPWPYPGSYWVDDTSRLSSYDIDTKTRLEGRDAVLEWLNQN